LLSQIPNLKLIAGLTPVVILFLTTITVNALTSQNANSSTIYEDFYNKCLIVSPGALCDYIFGKSPLNISNSSSLSSFSALTYSDKDLGFSMLYPLGWTIGHAPSFNPVVRFVSPQNNANVEVRIFPKGDYDSIDEYGQTLRDNHNEFKLLNYYRNSSTTLSERPALKAIYLTGNNASIENTNPNDPVTSKEMTIATMVPEKDSIYSITYSTKPPRFNNYIPIVERMMDSFRIYV
jgi:hypothetical protein